MKVAVVILNYNGVNLLPNYLPSVLDYTPSDVDIVVIDNASTDESNAWLDSYSDRIKLIALDENYGFAGGYNEGLKQVEADLYFLLNSDIEVTSGWIAPLIAAFEQSKSTGAVVPKILSVKNRDEFEYAGASGGLIDRYGYAFCRGRMVDTIEKDIGQYNSNMMVSWGSGCALGIRSQLFHGLGGFDDAFFAHFEEIDLCWRLRRAGFSIRCLPDSVVYHLGGGTLDYVSPRKLYLNFRNSLYMLYKNLSGWTCFSTLFIRMILDGAAGFTYLLKGEFSSVKAVFRAHFKFYSSISRLRKRSTFENNLIQHTAIGAYQRDGEYNGSIIWDYFIAKKKKYSQLTLL